MKRAGAIASRNGYSVSSTIVTGTPLLTRVRTSLGAYAIAAMPSSLVPIHRLDTNFGQP